jgi:chitinase
VLLSDGTVVFEDGMAPTEDVPTPAEMAQAKAAGRKLLLSIGGAAAGIDLTSPAVVNRFVQTVIPVLEQWGFDGIDIDIETGLVCGPSITQLSASQQGLINLINGVLNHFGPNFMLTMAPETAYVTGGGIAYGGPWGAYLPIINAFRNRLNWIQMQYYNGSMYGKNGTSYQAGTVEGMVRQTEAMVDGFNVANNGFFQGLPQEKVVIGLPATPGAGGGYMSPALVQQAFNQLHAQYPRLRGLMTWSANWDASNNYQFINSHRPYLNNLGPIQ